MQGHIIDGLSAFLPLRPLHPEHTVPGHESGDMRDIKIDWFIESKKKLIFKHPDKLSNIAYLMLVNLHGKIVLLYCIV